MSKSVLMISTSHLNRDSKDCRFPSSLSTRQRTKWQRDSICVDKKSPFVTLTTLLKVFLWKGIVIFHTTVLSSRSKVGLIEKWEGDYGEDPVCDKVRDTIRRNWPSKKLVSIIDVSSVLSSVGDVNESPVWTSHLNRGRPISRWMPTRLKRHVSMHTYALDFSKPEKTTLWTLYTRKIVPEGRQRERLGGDILDQRDTLLDGTSRPPQNPSKTGRLVVYPLYDGPFIGGEVTVTGVRQGLSGRRGGKPNWWRTDDKQQICRVSLTV